MCTQQLLTKLTVTAWMLAMSVAATASNPVVVENANPGTAAWQLVDPATNREIEGYASAPSAGRLQSLALYVNTQDAWFTVSVYRMGWYGGLGGRQVLGPVTVPGTVQTMPVMDPATGLLECNWKKSYSLIVPAWWVSGIYLAKLTGASGKQSYIIFAVRDDARASDFLFQQSVTTYEAYNNWPGTGVGKSLYSWQSNGGAANHVSFNRPYALGIQAASKWGVGAGDFLTNTQQETAPAGWEYNMVRFLEKEGYDVTYATSIDTHTNAAALLPHKGFLSVGHDEYWSYQMRSNIEAARDKGVNLAFFASNVCYKQIRLQPDSRGVANRTIICYRENPQLDPYFLDGDPSNDSLITTSWRLLQAIAPSGKPSEDSLVGILYINDPVQGPMTVADTTSAPWVFAGTGLTPGDSLAGLVGYEADGLGPNTPAGTILLFASPIGPLVYYCSVYTAASGATVFATGTMQWSFGLDDYNAGTGPNLRASLLNPAAQQITRNILAKFKL